MPRKEIRDNFRVEIIPNVRCYGFVVADEQEACEKIVEQVRRHVDDVSSVRVVSDDASACEFCGRRWTEDDARYNGGCCDKDQELEDQRLAALQRQINKQPE